MATTGEWAAVRAVLRWSGQPGTVLAVLVLLFNDGVGKERWPGAVTGKLSDLAWMLVAPPMLALLVTPLLRLRGDGPALFGVAGTAVAFTLAKSGPAGGAIASAIWSSSGVPSRIKGDPADLMALPLLAVAWWLWRRSRRPARWRESLAVVAVPLAVLAMAATSEIPKHYELWSAAGRPVLDVDKDRWTTDDGGTTWTLLEQDPGPRDDSPPPAAGHCSRTLVTRCYRLLDDHSAVEVSEDGGASWQPAFDPFPAWGLSPARPHPAPTSTGTSADPDRPQWDDTLRDYLRPAQVLLVDTDGGEFVLAQYPGWGLAVRGPDGSWSVRRYPKRPADAAVPRDWGRGLPVAVTVGWAAALAAVGARRVRSAPPDRRRRFAGGLAFSEVLLLAWVLGAWLYWRVPGMLTLAVVSVLSLWLLLFLGLLWRELGGLSRPSPGPVLLGAVFGAAALAPYLLWAHGTVPSWSAASALAFGCALLGTVAGLALGGIRPRRRAVAERHM
ncbi:hypothetical protein [Kitasatospora cinereorecta]|uniref:Uncharacterized protein n=1 Tax=Kitasatospora cinereorecta TaxID=285560 RepID=A0ABW0VFR9_9ACTN